MMLPTDEHELIRARDLYRTDTDQALEIYRALLTSRDDHVRNAAHVELAEHEFGSARYEIAAELYKRVVEAPIVEPSTVAVAGIHLANSREMLDVEVDESLLRLSIAGALATQQPRDAATGMTILSRVLMKRDELIEARAWMNQAIELYDAAKSLAGPATLLQLARLDRREGKLDDARGHLDLALAKIPHLPYGPSGDALKKRIRALQQEIDAETTG